MLQVINIQNWQTAAIKGCAVIIPTVNTEKGMNDCVDVGVTCN